MSVSIKCNVFENGYGPKRHNSIDIYKKKENRLIQTIMDLN